MCLDNVEAGATDERTARAPGMEPGWVCTKDRTTLTHNAKGRQASVVAECTNLFDKKSAAISGLLCPGSNTNGGSSALVSAPGSPTLG